MQYPPATRLPYTPTTGMVRSHASVLHQHTMLAARASQQVWPAVSHCHAYDMEGMHAFQVLPVDIGARRTLTVLHCSESSRQLRGSPGLHHSPPCCATQTLTEQRTAAAAAAGAAGGKARQRHPGMVHLLVLSRLDVNVCCHGQLQMCMLCWSHNYTPCQGHTATANINAVYAC
jgi:hypothetical protein